MLTNSRPAVAVLPDIPDTRLLVELTSHAGDLSEASHALSCAFAAGEDSELWMPLTSHAVTAYVRPFIRSNVRSRLDHMPAVPSIPEDLRPVHEVVRKYRNTTIAHSQSNLVMPLTLALLDGDGKASDVVGVSILHPMPFGTATRFTDLVAAMEDAVEEAARPVKERLRRWVREQAPETLGQWEQPRFLDATDADFTAARSRKRSPECTMYWQGWDPDTGSRDGS